MNARLTLLLLGGSIIANSLFGQDSYTAPVEVRGNSHLVQMDHVATDLRTIVPAHIRGGALRIVETRDDGLYHVRIRSAQHIQRMQGSYLDRDLTLPHGRFIYYHPNGRIESVGEYENGVKVGTWYTQDITGQGRAERSYSGLTVDALLVDQGVHEQARVVRR